MPSAAPEFVHDTDSGIRDLWALARRNARQCRAGNTPEDVAQETLLEYLRQRSSVRNPAAWVTTVAQRLSWKLAKRDPPFNEQVANQWVLPRDLQIDIRRALRRLDGRSRRLLLWAARGETHLEIAAKLGCERRDVGALVARARIRLARLTGSLSQNKTCQQRPIKNTRK